MSLSGGARYCKRVYASSQSSGSGSTSKTCKCVCVIYNKGLYFQLHRAVILILWNIIINSLIALLSKAPNVRLVVYADDIMIMIQGPSTADILNTLDNTLRGIETWCKEHRLEISKEKSALMPMYARN